MLKLCHGVSRMALATTIKDQINEGPFRILPRLIMTASQKERGSVSRLQEQMQANCFAIGDENP